MRLTKPILFTAVAGVLLYSLFRKSAGAGSLNFFPSKVHSFEFDGLTPVVTIGLGVQNTSNQSFTLNSFAGKLFSNSYYIGNLSSFVKQTIYPNSQQIIYIKARLQPLGIVNDIIRAIDNKNFSQEIIMKATANVDRLQVPVNLQFKVGL